MVPRRNNNRKKRKVEETKTSDIRAFIRKQILPNDKEVDEEDAETLVTIVERLLAEMFTADDFEGPEGSIRDEIPAETLAVIERYRYEGLSELEKKWKNFVGKCTIQYNGPPREGIRTTRRTTRRRITSISIDGSYTTGIYFETDDREIDTSSLHHWEFHSPWLLDLLAKFECLEELKIKNVDSFRLTETLARFPNLKNLHCGDISATATKFIMGPTTILKGKKSKLETFQLPRFMKSDDLATFLFDILPFCPRLTTIKAEDHAIGSYRKIAQRISNNNPSTKACSSKLRQLDGLMRDEEHFEDYEDFTNFENPYLYLNTRLVSLRDPLEAEAVKKILLFFPELSDIYHLYEIFENVEEKIKYDETSSFADLGRLVEMNSVGRVLVESKKSVPLSLWPFVLARAKNKGIYTRTVPTGLYYLVQNLPELFDRNNTVGKR